MSIPTRLALVVITCFAPVAARAELAAIRPEFQVSTGPAYSPDYGYVYPHTEAKSSNHIAGSPTGTFVVAWEDYYFQAANGTFRPGIFARRLDNLGRPLAGEFRASPLTSYIKGASHVASDDAGNFVVVWDETDQYYTYPADDDGTRIMARRFNASGGALGSSFLVLVKTPANPKRSVLTWRFARGAATDADALGDPFTTDSYAVCLYDGSADAQPRFEADVPAGGACGAVPCWKLLSGNRIDYFDKTGFVRGVSLVRMTPGSQGKARALVKGKGTDLALRSLPLTTPVVFQLQAANGACWTATYATRVKRNDGTIFKANPDS